MIHYLTRNYFVFTAPAFGRYTVNVFTQIAVLVHVHAT